MVFWIIQHVHFLDYRLCGLVSFDDEGWGRGWARGWGLWGKWHGPPGEVLAVHSVRAKAPVYRVHEECGGHLLGMGACCHSCQATSH